MEVNTEFEKLYGPAAGRTHDDTDCEFVFKNMSAPAVMSIDDKKSCVDDDRVELLAHPQLSAVVLNPL